VASVSAALTTRCDFRNRVKIGHWWAAGISDLLLQRMLGHWAVGHENAITCDRGPRGPLVTGKPHHVPWHFIRIYARI
jgi:hypothetical protein